MKSFLKYVLATIVGILITSLFLFFIVMAMVAGIMSSSSTSTQVENNTVFVLDLKGELEERSTGEDPFSLYFDIEKKGCALNDILNSIRKAKENDKIQGIYIKAGDLSAGFASLEEIRNALKDFRESGKWIVAYGDNYTQGLYYVGSVADEVLMNPQGLMEWRGLAATPMFYKDLLDKVGVEMQVFRVGTFKSAVEPYLGNSMSEANRKQMTELLTSVWSQMTAQVGEGRSLDPSFLQQQADSALMFFTADKVVEAGLVDSLVYENDMRDYLKKFNNKKGDYHMLGLAEMVNVDGNKPKDMDGNIVAVYYLTGEIVQTDDESSPMSLSTDGIVGQKVIKDLRELKEDKHVKAVVLRVNSPGGSAYASEQIWEAVKQLKKEKPVIVSMGDYAASGGYYISCLADTIVADPTTITGSIGIFGMFPNAEKLANKVGVHVETVKTNKYADFGNLTRPMTADEQRLLQMYIEKGYDLFLSRVSEGRHIDKVQLDSIAQGRVWSGEDALKIGLVDVLGDLDKAVDIAVAKAGVEKYTLRDYPGPKGMLESLKSSLNPSRFIKARILKSRLGEYYEPYKLLEDWEHMDNIQARMPYIIQVR